MRGKMGEEVGRQGIHGNEVQTLLAGKSAGSATEAQLRESQEALAARRGTTDTWSKAAALTWRSLSD